MNLHKAYRKYTHLFIHAELKVYEMTFSDSKPHLCWVFTKDDWLIRFSDIAECWSVAVSEPNCLQPVPIITICFWILFDLMSILHLLGIPLRTGPLVSTYLCANMSSSSIQNLWQISPLAGNNIFTSVLDCVFMYKFYSYTNFMKLLLHWNIVLEVTEYVFLGHNHSYLAPK